MRNEHKYIAMLTARNFSSYMFLFRRLRLPITRSRRTGRCIYRWVCITRFLLHHHKRYGLKKGHVRSDHGTTTYIRWKLGKRYTRIRSNLWYLICLRHIIRFESSHKVYFFLRKDLFFFMRLQHVLSYHLTYQYHGVDIYQMNSNLPDLLEC